MVRVVLHRKRRPLKRPVKRSPKAVEVTPTPTLETTSSSEDDDDFFIPDDDSPHHQIGNATTTLSYIPQYLPSSSSISSISNDLSSSIRNSISLDRLDEEESHEDAEVAVAILESFFFGGPTSSSSKPNQVSKVERKGASANGRATTTYAKPVSTPNGDLPSSPTSTLIPPFPGSTIEQRARYARQSQSTSNLVIQTQPQQQRSSFSQTNHPPVVERTQSMPTILPPGSPHAHTTHARGPPPKKPVLKRTGSSTCSLNSSKRNVSFTEVQFREYNVALSHHPSCSFGPPVELGWEYNESEALTVEDYEVSRSPRRETHELLLSYNARRRMLMKQAGYSKEDLKQAEKEVDRVKRGRMMTEIFLPAQVIDENLERFFGFLKRTFQPQLQVRATAVNE